MGERDNKGRFAKGNKASPGRKPRHTEAQYLEAMYGVAAPDEWAQAAKKMLDLAVSGDVQAFRAIAPYLAGLPAQKLQLASHEAALLSDVLDKLKARGVSTRDVLEALLVELEGESDAS